MAKRRKNPSGNKIAMYVGGAAVAGLAGYFIYKAVKKPAADAAPGTNGGQDPSNQSPQLDGGSGGGDGGNFPKAGKTIAFHAGAGLIEAATNGGGGKIKTSSGAWWDDQSQPEGGIVQSISQCKAGLTTFPTMINASPKQWYICVEPQNAQVGQTAWFGNDLYNHVQAIAKARYPYFDIFPGLATGTPTTDATQGECAAGSMDENTNRCNPPNENPGNIRQAGQPTPDATFCASQKASYCTPADHCPPQFKFVCA